MNKNRQCPIKQSRITLVQLVLRGILALSVLIFYFADRTALDFAADGKVFSLSVFSSPLLLVIWLFMLTDFFLRLFPLPFTPMGAKKSFAAGYKARNPEISTEKDRKHFKRLQLDALRAVVVYLLVNGVYFIPFILIRSGVWTPRTWTFLPRFLTEFLAGIGAPELVVATMIYYTADIVFIRWWCLFRNVVNRNRCCATCRIYCWDGIMCTTPLLLCPLTLFSSTLLILALISFFRHEIAFYKHPEHFNESQNALLSCSECQNDVCPRKNCGKKR